METRINKDPIKPSEWTTLWHYGPYGLSEAHVFHLPRRGWTFGKRFLNGVVVSKGYFPDWVWCTLALERMPGFFLICFGGGLMEVNEIKPNMLFPCGSCLTLPSFFALKTQLLREYGLVFISVKHLQTRSPYEKGTYRVSYTPQELT